VSKEEEYLIDL